MGGGDGDAQIPGYRHSSLSKPHVYSNLEPRTEKVSAAAFLPGLVSIMNTFWFYGIIQIHYDACQIIP